MGGQSHYRPPRWQAESGSVSLEALEAAFGAVPAGSDRGEAPGRGDARGGQPGASGRGPGTNRPEPPWLVVLATTVRLWLRRRMTALGRLELTHTPEQPGPASEASPPEPAPAPELTQDGEPGHPPQQSGPFPAPEPAPGLEPAQAAELPEGPEPTHTPERPEPLPASEPASEGQMWAVLYDGGMSLTTAIERIARSLAEAERQRGRRVTVRRLDDVETHPRGVEKPVRRLGRARGEGLVRPRGTDKPSVPGPSRAVGGADSVPEPKPIRPAERFARPKPISEPEPAPAPEPALAPAPAQALEPTQAVEPTQAAEPASVSGPASEASPPVLTREPEPARAPAPASRRRLLLYALAAAGIVVAAALVDHWGVLPGVGATTSSSPAQVGGPARRPQLLPPLDQPPVMHFSDAVDATPAPAESSAQPASPAAGPSAARNPAARPAGSPASAGSPQSATGEGSGGGPSAIARGG